MLIIGTPHLCGLVTAAVCGWVTNLCPTCYVIEAALAATYPLPDLMVRNARIGHLECHPRVGSVWTGKERELHLQYVHRLCLVKSIAIFLITSFEPVYPK